MKVVRHIAVRAFALGITFTALTTAVAGTRAEAMDFCDNCPLDTSQVVDCRTANGHTPDPRCNPLYELTCRMFQLNCK